MHELLSLWGSLWFVGLQLGQGDDVKHHCYFISVRHLSA